MFANKRPRFFCFSAVVAALLAGSTHVCAQSGTRGSVPSVAPAYSAPPAIYTPPASTFSAPPSSYQQMAPIRQSYPQHASPSFSTAQPYAAAPQYYAPSQSYRSLPPTYYYRPSYQSQPLYQGYVYPSYRPAYDSSFAPSCR